MRIFITLALSASTLGGLTGVFTEMSNMDITVPVVAFNEPVIDEPFVPGSMLFVGDVMLARRIETIMASDSPRYPFEELIELLNEPTVTVGNFEGTIPATHVPTPELTYQFSVRKEHLPVLRDVGFDVMSLANNHTFDHGKEAYEHTIRSCEGASLLCVGHPYDAESSSTALISIGDTTVGMYFIHTLFEEPDASTTESVLASLRTQSDMQLVFVHWGEEYELEHNTIQETFAHRLIDEGADAVIGHHSHVVQDIELYEGRPIFYSLGNFIFDQYFSDDVQIGLTVKLVANERETTYELIPITSTTTRSRPSLLEGEGRMRLLERVLGASGAEHPESIDVLQGILRVPRQEDLHVAESSLSLTGNH